MTNHAIIARRAPSSSNLRPSLFQPSANSDSALTITTSNKKEAPQESSMISTGEQVIMNTALVEAGSLDESSHEPVRVLLGTGSYQTYVTEDLVKKPQLRTEGTNKIQVYLDQGSRKISLLKSSLSC